MKNTLSTLFILFLLVGCTSESKEKKAVIQVKKQPITTIYIQSFTGFPSKRTTLISKVLIAFYKIETKILEKKPIFESTRLAGTNRFGASKILDVLLNEKILETDKILGLTNFDIYTAKEIAGVINPYWGIFGLGYCPGKSCIISDFRLNQFGNKADEFVIKVVLHEIGHTFGLPHCDKDPRCLMNDAKGTIKTLFREEKWLCPSCRNLLKKSKSYSPIL